MHNPPLSNDDYGPQNHRSIDPATALAQLESILGSGPEGRDIVTQCRQLKTWAQESGIFFTPGIEITQARIGGLEHLVWFDEAAQRVVKTTYGGCFGRTVRRIQAGLAPASPIEYLRRWSLHNHLFGAITSIVGVTNLRDDSLEL